jgi:DNA-binding IclR family transcriptional regulator
MSALVRQGAHFAFHDDRVSARVITAFQSDERRTSLFEELLNGSRASRLRRQRLDERLDAIRSRGYDSGPSDTLSGVVDICFPIFDQFGVVAALTVVYLRQRDARITIAGARGILHQAAGTISRSLGWSPRGRAVPLPS